MSLPGRRRAARTATESRDGVQRVEVVRDAGDALVAALEESDTAVETIHDSGADARHRAGRGRAWWRIGVAGLVLAAISVFVTRRRR